MFVNIIVETLLGTMEHIYLYHNIDDIGGNLFGVRVLELGTCF